MFINADAPDSQAASTEAERLILQYGVKLIIGSYSSGNSLAISAVTERNSVVLWETSAISDEITSKGFKYLFRFCDRGSHRGEVAIHLIAELVAPRLGIPLNEIKVAVVNEDSSFGESQVNSLLKEAKKLGINIVSHERYSSSSAIDMTAMILRLKEKEPDVIFAVSYINDAILFWNQVQQYGANIKAFIGGGGGWIDPKFGEVQGQGADGILVVDMPTNISIDKYKMDDTRQLAEKFRSMYLKESGEDTVPLPAEVSFAGTYILLHDVLPKARPSYDADGIIEAAKTLDIKETTMGWTVHFDETGQNKGAMPVTYQWEDGKTVIVWPSQWAEKEVKNIPLPSFIK
jgi:branched-chain amino acid transport system substrate-binding protein